MDKKKENHKIDDKSLEKVTGGTGPESDPDLDSSLDEISKEYDSFERCAHSKRKKGLLGKK